MLARVGLKGNPCLVPFEWHWFGTSQFTGNQFQAIRISRKKIDVYYLKKKNFVLGGAGGKIVSTS